MGLFKRISDIVSANFNDMVEGYEDPEQLLRQAVREMEDAIRDAKPEVAKAMAAEKLTRKELQENESQVTTWTERARSAVDAGDDGLARKALTRKKEHEKIVGALQDQLQAATESAQTLRRQLEAMEAKLADAQRRLGTLAARKRAADVRTRVASAQLAHPADLGHEAFDKFERLSRRVAQAEAEADAMSELAGGRAANRTESRQSEVDVDIETELLALKKR